MSGQQRRPRLAVELATRWRIRAVIVFLFLASGSIAQPPGEDLRAVEKANEDAYMRDARNVEAIAALEKVAAQTLGKARATKLVEGVKEVQRGAYRVGWANGMGHEATKMAAALEEAQRLVREHCKCDDAGVR